MDLANARILFASARVGPQRCLEPLQTWDSLDLGLGWSMKMPQDENVPGLSSGGPTDMNQATAQRVSA